MTKQTPPRGATGPSIVDYAIPFVEIVRKRFIILLRYRLNFTVQMVTMYLFFAMVFFGGQALIENLGASGRSLAPTFEGIIVGWFLWTMAQSAYSSLAKDIRNESEWGTLEQLYTSKYGFGALILLKIVANLLQSVITGLIILALMLVTTGRVLTIDVFTVPVIVLFALASISGIGLVFAGLALIYKNISSFSAIMQFVIIGLIGAPVSEQFLLRLLPLVQGSAMLQRAMRKGTRLWEFAPLDLAVLAGAGVAYLAVGYVVFRVCSRIARRRGVMGDY